MADTFFNGSEQILFILVDGLKVPIACLTDNSFQESVEMLNTTTADNKGWKTGRPLTQSYSISFSGIQIESNFGAPQKASLDILRILKRRRELISWVIDTGTTFTEGGQGYIVNLSESSSADGLLTFSGQILGYGILATQALKEPSNYIFQGNEENYIFQ